MCNWKLRKKPYRWKEKNIIFKISGWSVKKWPKRNSFFFTYFYFLFIFCQITWDKRCARSKLVGVDKEKNSEKKNFQRWTRVLSSHIYCKISFLLLKIVWLKRGRKKNDVPVFSGGHRRWKLLNFPLHTIMIS